MSNEHASSLLKSMAAATAVRGDKESETTTTPMAGLLKQLADKKEHDAIVEPSGLRSLLSVPTKPHPTPNSSILGILSQPASNSTKSPMLASALNKDVQNKEGQTDLLFSLLQKGPNIMPMTSSTRTSSSSSSRLEIERIAQQISSQAFAQKSAEKAKKNAKRKLPPVETNSGDNSRSNSPVAPDVGDRIEADKDNSEEPNVIKRLLVSDPSAHARPPATLCVVCSDAFDGTKTKKFFSVFPDHRHQQCAEMEDYGLPGRLAKVLDHSILPESLASNHICITCVGLLSELEALQAKLCNFKKMFHRTRVLAASELKSPGDAGSSQNGPYLSPNSGRNPRRREKDGISFGDMVAGMLENGVSENHGNKQQRVLNIVPLHDPTTDDDENERANDATPVNGGGSEPGTLGDIAKTFLALTETENAVDDDPILARLVEVEKNGGKKRRLGGDNADASSAEKVDEYMGVMVKSEPGESESHLKIDTAEADAFTEMVQNARRDLAHRQNDMDSGVLWDYRFRVHAVTNSAGVVYQELRTSIKGREVAMAFRCTKCWKLFCNRKAFEVHLQCHTDDTPRLVCFLCSFLSTTNWRLLRQHLLTSHRLAPEMQDFNRYTCFWPECHVVYGTESELKRHLELHARPKSNHRLSDNGVFEFVCEHGCQIHSRQLLDVHSACHMRGSKQFRCAWCNYSHPSQPGAWRLMKSHLQKSHPELAEVDPDLYNTHECPQHGCKEKFCSESAIQMHIQCHVDGSDSEFRCAVCGVRMLWWDSMKKHLIEKHPDTFTWLDALHCTCGLSFADVSSFMAHRSHAWSDAVADGKQGSSQLARALVTS